MQPDYVWVEIAPGRKRLVDRNKPRPQVARSKLAFPMIVRDTFSEPLQSMADGKYYDSRSALYRSYRADGNPQGVDYEVVGDAPIEPFSPPAKTKAEEDATDAAIARALEEAGL